MKIETKKWWRKKTLLCFTMNHLRYESKYWCLFLSSLVSSKNLINPFSFSVSSVLWTLVVTISSDIFFVQKLWEQTTSRLTLLNIWTEQIFKFNDSTVKISDNVEIFSYDTLANKMTSNKYEWRSTNLFPRILLRLSWRLLFCCRIAVSAIQLQ